MIPRSPIPMKAPTQDYEIKDVPLIRQDCPELADHSDGEIACLWEWHSCEFWCAGWMMYCHPELFMEELRKAKAEVLLAEYAESWRRADSKFEG